MAQSYFIWNGVDCRAMGVRLAGPVAVTWPEERIGHINIPGRSGDLTELEGTDIFNSYIQTAEIKCRDWARLGLIKKWLRGSGYVTFSGEPNRKQQARIIGAVTLNKHSRNMDLWEGSVQFHCQPFKEKQNEEAIRVISSGTVIRNGGDVISRPRITVNAAGAGQDVRFSINEREFHINLTTMADTGCVVDSAAEVVSNYSGAADLTILSDGAFPFLDVGDNTINLISGLASLDIEKKERFF